MSNEPTKTPTVKLDDLNMPTGTRNAIAKYLQSHPEMTLADIINMGPEKMQMALRNFGATAMTVFTIALRARGIEVPWLKSISSYTWNVDERNPRTLREEGWNQLTTPYVRSEYWMLVEAIAQLEKSGIRWRVFQGWSNPVKEREARPERPSKDGKKMLPATEAREARPAQPLKRGSLVLARAGGLFDESDDEDEE